MEIRPFILDPRYGRRNYAMTGHQNDELSRHSIVKCPPLFTMSAGTNTLVEQSSNCTTVKMSALPYDSFQMVAKNSTEYVCEVELHIDNQFLNFCISVVVRLRICNTPSIKTALLPSYFYKFQRNNDLRQNFKTFVYPVLTDYLIRVGQTNYSESNRLKTFETYPRWAAVSTKKLAKSGFSYTGHGDEVLCFSCDGKLSSWHYDDEPNVRHRQKFPNCNFMNGSDTSNIPLGGSFNESLDIDNCNVLPSNARLGSNSRNYYSDLARNTRNTSTRDEDDPLTAEEYQVEMKIERNRLQTYTGWPTSAPVNPDELSRNGFYYTGTDDRVQCAFCHGILRNWELGDRIFVEHCNYFPHCGFVRGEDVGNVQLDTGADRLDDPLDADILGSCFCASAAAIMGQRPEYLAGDPRNATGFGSNTFRPKKPSYTSVLKRLSTFETWPITMRQRPEQLADAGFCYMGILDNVECFYCGGGLRNWEPDDDPWTEHGRWFPRCEYVRREKGDVFIREFSKHYVHIYDGEMPIEPAINITNPEMLAVLTNIRGVEYLAVGPEQDTAIKTPNDKADSKRVGKCKICKVENRNAVFLPCGHLISCQECAKSFVNCTICHSSIQTIVKPLCSCFKEQTMGELPSSLKVTPYTLRKEEHGKFCSLSPLCCICKKENEVLDFLLIPCCHLVLCKTCSWQFYPDQTCPVCNKTIIGTKTVIIE